MLDEIKPKVQIESSREALQRNLARSSEAKMELRESGELKHLMSSSQRRSSNLVESER